MKIRRIVCLIVILGLGLFPFAGIARSALTENLPLDDAKKEGALLIYHSPNLEDIKKLADKFHERYPSIAVQQYRNSVTSLYPRIRMEARAGVYKPDVIIINAIYNYLLKKEGLLRAYDIPERKSIRKELQFAGGYYDPLFMNTYVMAYNTRLVQPENAPKTYQDLLDPRWKGKICIVGTIYEWYLGMQKYMQEEAADSYLRKLSDQNVIVRSDRTLVAQLLAAGEFSIAVGVYANEVEKLKSMRAPIEWVGASPVVANMPSMSIASHAPHPSAAQLFINFSLSREGQTVVRDFKRIPVRQDVKPSNPRMVDGIDLVAIPPESVEKWDNVATTFKSFFKSVKTK
jgi:iron(III) transport system substrate-binding protein